MASIKISLVCPDALTFYGEADQVDLPGLEGDMGVLAGHAPIVTVLRPGLVSVFVNGHSEKFVVMGGIAEFSNAELTILADAAKPIAEFDVVALKAEIEERERSLPVMSIGQELDQALASLDHYKSLHQYLTVTTAM